MDECDNLVINLEAYEELDTKQQINDNDAEIANIIGFADEEEEDEEEEVDEEAEDNDNVEEVAIMGQTESKKSAKKYSANCVETKGTAMSFGFRKKLNSTPKKLKKLLEGSDMKHKKHDKCNNPTGSSQDDENCEIIGTVINNDMIRDDNGNAAETLSTIYFEKMGAAAAAATTATNTIGKSALKATNGNQGVTMGEHLPGANNRFGFRGCNIPRPASTGTTTRHHQQQEQQQLNDARDNIDNNNCSLTENLPKGSLVSNLKRRSKSANTGRTLTANKDDEADGRMAPKITQPKTITFNLNQNTTIEYQRRQFFEHPTTADTSYGRFVNQVNSINTGMHTNVIVRPTPRTALASYSKFTLQTVSLPRPEFPVAISLTATTPTTPSSTFSPTKTPTTTTTNSSAASASAAATAHNGSGARAKDITMTQHRHSQHPLTFASQTAQFDQKSVKQMTNNSTRRGFSGSREISADSGIASMDMALESNSSSSSGMSKRQASPKRSRSRPRHLQMVMNGRHKFEVRELDDPLSSESSSCVEPLSLPKLPAENQTMPLPLCGLVRSNTVLSRESYERKNDDDVGNPNVELPGKRKEIVRNPSEESESIDEEKLYLDCSTSEKSTKHRQFRDINTCSSKTSSPGSSIMSSWCNAGESLAMKDCSSLSISSSEDSNKQANKQNNAQANNGEHGDLTIEPNDDDNSLINTDMQISTISSITETQTAPQTLNDNLNFNDNKLQEQMMQIIEDDVDNMCSDRPKSFLNAFNEAKFAEIALAGSKYLLDDETSPTDSLVSSTDSDDAGGGCDKLKKHKFNEELQEKDIDEISPELEVGSPISPGTPTHASRSLSFSECGNLIDDEIADQPALLFNNDSNQESGNGVGAESHKDKTDTPTLIETPSIRSLKSQSKARTALQQAIELSLRTPISIRKAVMERAESLDTLSPCESICSDDLMMDFETNSSIDSIDRSASIKSRSGSDLNKIDETTLFSELDRRGSDVMKELNTLLKVRLDRKSEKESVIANLPARATRLLNRSRLQQQCPLNNADSDSSKSAQSIHLRSATGSRTSTRSTPTNTSAQQFHIHHHNSLNHHTNSYSQSHHPQKQQSQQYQRLQKRDTHSSSDDLMLYDKSFRNAMIQDVLQFKKQLLRLRRILQETETLNPFENDNGQLFATCGLDSKQLDDIDLASLTSSTTDDPMQELADLRRQGQVDDRDRTIRLQRNLIEKLEAEKSTVSLVTSDAPKECTTIATQTERTRPPAIGAEGLSRSKPEFTSYTTYFPALYCNDATKIIRHQQQYPGNAMNAMNNQTRRHTVISATLTNYNHHHPHHHSTNNLNQQLAATTSATTVSAKSNGYMPRRASIAWETQVSSNYQPATTITTTATTSTSNPTPTPTTLQYKPVRITLIGEPINVINGTTTNTNTNTNANTTTTSLSENGKNLIINSNNSNNNRQFDCKNNFLNCTTNDLLLTNNLNNSNNNNNNNNNFNNNSYKSHNNTNNSNNITNLNNNNNINCKAQNGYTKVRLSSENLQKYSFNDFDKQLQQQEQHKQQLQQQQQQQQQIQTQQQFHSNYNNFKSDKLNPTVTIV